MTDLIPFAEVVHLLTDEERRRIGEWAAKGDIARLAGVIWRLARLAHTLLEENARLKEHPLSTAACVHAEGLAEENARLTHEREGAVDLLARLLEENAALRAVVETAKTTHPKPCAWRYTNAGCQLCAALDAAPGEGKESDV